MANRAIVYVLYPNKIQNEQCQKTFGCCRFVHNQMLTIQQERYKNGDYNAAINIKKEGLRLLSA